MDDPVWMTSRPPESNNQNRDHWEVYADAMDLTIEGHRLIAEEIVYEVKLLWRGVMSRLLDVFSASTRRGSTPST